MPGKHKWKSTLINSHFLIYDYETGGRDEFTTEPIEIGAIVADCRTLELKEGAEFHSLIKPTDWSLVHDDALQKNKITREELLEAPEQEKVFQQFFQFARQFQRSDKKWDALIPCGFNINKFDNIISKRMCKKYNYIDKDGDNLLLHPFHTFDLFDIIRLWFENTDELNNYNLDALRDYFGISKEGSHRALVDVYDTWKLLKRFLQMYRSWAPKKLSEFKGYFADE